MINEMLNDFRDETLEHLQLFEDNLLAVLNDGFTSETINAIFRAVHTIKGIAGMFNFTYIVDFTHVAESLLDKLRQNNVEVDSQKLSALLASKDHISDLINFALNNPDDQPDENGELAKVSKELISKLASFIKDKPIVDECGTEETIKIWKIKLNPSNSQTLFHGVEPAHFINYLNEMGSIEEMTTDLSKIPILDNFDPELYYLNHTVIFKSIAGLKEIEQVFNFISTLVTYEISRYDRRKTDVEDLSGNKNEKFVEKRILDDSPDKKVDLPETIIESRQEINLSNKQILKEEESNNEAQRDKTPKSNTLRVDSDRIDKLINLIGEMVIANANVVQKAISMKDKELLESTSVMTRMLEEIRESGMKMRMIPVGDTFNRFRRIVHDASLKLGKQIDLTIKGGETELDKTVIEKITDPLVHIIRNSVDHGIELPEERKTKGKSEIGKIMISAFHEAGSIAIQIADDGKGINKDVIYNKAIEKGMISAEEVLSEKEILSLIFKPGFSTAEQVTDLSGRGVGMEVVKKNIDALRGDIDIDTEIDSGTKMTIRLPLTLAIIDGFMVQVGSTSFIIPLDMLVECIELTDNHKKDMHGNNFINLRGKVLPLLKMADYFEEKSLGKRGNIVIVKYGEEMMGLIVDQLHGEFQTVIKPLGRLFQNVTGLSGATILGNGSVALILDIPILIQYAKSLKKKNNEEVYA
ncbi:MAG: chemotaxis protein CheA [Candidatus Delongbacteria bacterium]|nr:chemotaxis protein CheA [Candidatus Delongbacteria bacterium]MBN2833794.1 chemotaxis protein CheA [Candidatus Delongbacteria bacterium]